jgi:transcription elongation factor SPT6
LLSSSQFLYILRAEQEHLVNISIQLQPEAKSAFELRLNEAFASSSFSENAKAWNEERSRVVQETIEQHLIPAGVKWVREFIREEAEDYLANDCSAQLVKVRKRATLS